MFKRKEVPSDPMSPIKPTEYELRAKCDPRACGPSIGGGGASVDQSLGGRNMKPTQREVVLVSHVPSVEFRVECAAASLPHICFYSLASVQNQVQHCGHRILVMTRSV